MKERWRQLSEFPAYFVSDQGRVYSTKSKIVLSTARNKYPYDGVSIRIDGKGYYRTVHSLVASAFLGTRPIGEVIRHLDGNSKNNYLNNLSYGTQSQNCLDSVVHGVNVQANKKFCKKGHAFDTENTYTVTRKSNGEKRRICRLCGTERARKYRERKSVDKCPG